jgi:hypothetical protein
MSTYEIIILIATLVFCLLAYAIPMALLILFWRLNADYRRVFDLVPAFAERYDLRIQRQERDWYARWPRAVGDIGSRPVFLEPFHLHWYQRHRGLRLGMAVNVLTDISLQAYFPAEIPGRWQRNQEEGWSPLDDVFYTSHPPDLGDWLFIENELLDLKLEEHLGRFYQQAAAGRDFTLYGETGRLWIDFPDTGLTVDQLVIASQVLEKLAAALETYPEPAEVAGEDHDLLPHQAFTPGK